MAMLSLTISGVLAILVGLVILVWPKTLNIAVGLYLLVTGILQTVQF